MKETDCLREKRFGGGGGINYISYGKNELKDFFFGENSLLNVIVSHYAMASVLNLHLQIRIKEAQYSHLRLASCFLERS